MDQTVEKDPNKALALLDSITYPYDLSKAQYNRYLLLQVQAKDKAYKDITSDTVIFKVKDYYISRNSIEKKALATYYCGRVLEEQKKYKEAVSEYFTATEYAENTNNNALKGLIQSRIGLIFLKQYREAEAINHYLKSVDYFIAANHKRNEIASYRQIGVAYLLKAIDDSIFHDSTFYYYHKAFELAKTTNDSLLLANIIQSIGAAHHEAGNFKKAHEYLKKADKYIISDDDKSRLYLNMSNTFYERDMLDSAQCYIDKSLALHNTNISVSIYYTLAKIAEKQSNYPQALAYYEIYADNLSKAYDKAESVAILELQKKYRYEHFQNENNRLKIKEQRIYLIFSIILLIVCLISSFVYKRYLEKKKDILEAENKIYQLVEMSNSYDEKENSLRNVLLHHFDILKKTALLKQHIKTNDDQAHRLIKKVNEIIYGQESLNWEVLYQDMNKIHEGLFERLREKHPLLNETEFRVCCLTYADFSCTEIGIILGFSTNTVQMKRSDIRKKLGIESQGNIKEYIDAQI